MNYLLDTNACIAVINGRPERVRARLAKEVEGKAELAVSSIVLHELWYGVAKSSRAEANARRLAAFLAGPIDLVPFDDGDARTAGRLRASLESEGRPIGAYDLLIAGQALRRNLILVTANVREFRRVRGLVWEDWARSR
jgi:tRNA(fMet)-specific endonuclease VapC